jgi:predicted alpha-1,2-mannosidase
MARALGHRADARLLTRRARGYRTLWDRRLRLFSPRRSDGRRLDPYDPRTGAGQFHEGGAYQYQWLVPQDPAGLVGLLGGRGRAARRLDAVFDKRELLRNPSLTARKRWVEHPYEYYGAVTYNPNNEPDLHAPYLYAWTGQPWKTATVVRAAQTLFTNGPEGLTGNDDLGTMSAWYVLSSLGLYPPMSGAGFFVLSTPQFPHARLTLGAIGSRQGGTLTIDAPRTSADRRYIAAARIDGRPITRTWLTRAAVARGGRLAFAVSKGPTRWGTARSAAPPSVAGAG